MKKFALCVALTAMASTPLSAQTSAPVVVAQPRAEQPTTVLPANTEVLLSTNQEVTTKGKRWAAGDTFDLSVVHDVMLDGYVVIPRGSRAVGEITWMTDKGMFGKSGKMDIELRYIEVNGQRIEITGTYRQEGEGNTVATVAGVVAAGVFAAFITGKSGRIPQGRELMAHTKADLPVKLAGEPVEQKPALTANFAQPAVEAETAEPEALPEAEAPADGDDSAGAARK